MSKVTVTNSGATPVETHGVTIPAYGSAEFDEAVWKRAQNGGAVSHFLKEGVLKAGKPSKPAVGSTGEGAGGQTAPPAPATASGRKAAAEAAKKAADEKAAAEAKAAADKKANDEAAAAAAAAGTTAQTNVKG